MRQVFKKKQMRSWKDFAIGFVKTACHWSAASFDEKNNMQDVAKVSSTRIVSNI